MITTGASYNALAASRVIGAVLMVEADFLLGMQRWTTWGDDIVWNGNTYMGLGQLGSISELRETEAATNERITLKLSPVPVQNLPLALGSVEGYRGRPINIYFWAVGPDYQPVGSPVLRHQAVMDQVSIKRDKESGSVELVCLGAGANSTSRMVGERISHAQHVLKYPGERGLEYAASLVNQPQMWLSKRFQEI